MGKPCGEPLVERMARGQGGAHTHLTERGRQLVGNFAVVQQKHARFGERLNRQAGGLTRDYSMMESAMRGSTRNPFAGSVSRLTPGGVNSEVVLDDLHARERKKTSVSPWAARPRRSSMQHGPATREHLLPGVQTFHQADATPKASLAVSLIHPVDDHGKPATLV